MEGSEVSMSGRRLEEGAVMGKKEERDAVLCNEEADEQDGEDGASSEPKGLLVLLLREGKGRGLQDSGSEFKVRDVAKRGQRAHGWSRGVQGRDDFRPPYPLLSANATGSVR